MSNKIYDNLNEKQLEAVKYGKGPMLIIAGPGSGKTRVITHRIAHLIYALRVQPGNILATTFTNKAADEMRERLLSLIGWPAKRVWIGTVHSMCARLLRDCGAKRVGLAPNYTIYDPSKAGTVLGRVIKDLQPAAVRAARTYEDRQALEDMGTAIVQESIEEAKEKGLHPPEFAKTGRTGRLIESYYHEYNHRLREANAADFGDLQLLTVDLLTEHPDIRSLVQKRFQYTLVDEFQDTNNVQAELFKLIGSGTKNLTVVGDLDQSIYMFRFANPSNIRHFTTDWPDAHIVQMGMNYRSTPNIVKAAGSVIKNNPDRFPLEFATIRPEGEPPRIIRFRNEEEAALAAARIVIAHYSQDKIPLSEMAILYRFHRASRALESAFRLRGIPYTVVGGVPFYERREIADLLSWLALVANPADVEAFARASRTPPRGVGATTVEAVRKLAENIKTNMIEAARRITGLRAQQRQGLTELVELWDDFRARADDPDLLVTIVNTIKYIPFLRTEEDDITNRLLNIEEMLRSYNGFCQQVLLIRKAGEKSNEAVPEQDTLIDVARFQKMIEVEPETKDAPPATAVEMFMENIMLQKAAVKEEEKEDEKVRLSTVHSAKGTEFRVVIVMGCEQGTMPPFRSMIDSEDMEEERRVFYVAMTRAKDHLYLMHSREALVFKDKPTMTAMEPSQFLYEARAGGAIEINKDDLPRPREFGPIRIISGGEVVA